MMESGVETSKPSVNMEVIQSRSDWGALSSSNTASHWGKRAAAGARGGQWPKVTPGGNEVPGGKVPATQGHTTEELGNVVLQRLHLCGYLHEVDREQPEARLKSWQIKAIGGAEGLALTAVDAGMFLPRRNASRSKGLVAVQG